MKQQKIYVGEGSISLYSFTRVVKEFNEKSGSTTLNGVADAVKDWDSLWSDGESDRIWLTDLIEGRGRFWIFESPDGSDRQWEFELVCSPSVLRYIRYSVKLIEEAKQEDSRFATDLLFCLLGLLGNIECSFYYIP